jgi:hypothetical protein
MKAVLDIHIGCVFITFSGDRSSHVMSDFM